MNTPLVWVHGDYLDPRGPALVAHPESPAVFVFDDALLEFYKLTFKRLVFLYECLLEIPGIHIRKGEPVAEIAAAVQEFGCNGVVTVASVAPQFGRQVVALKAQHYLTVEILPQPPLVTLDKGEDETLDLKRFSRYWGEIQRRAMDPRY